MKKLVLIISLFYLFLTGTNAQINPPDFLCMKGDSLFWDLPVNTCGPFVSYDIYVSDNAAGPFTLLSSVTDPAQTAFEHPNPAGDLQYYYLLSNFNCPGETQISSDTLNNRPPEVSPLNSVSVQGGDVLLDWSPSPSPEVIGYIIYRRDPIGVIPIDTVFGNVTDYIDTNAEPDMESEGYFINALDQCDNTSIFDLEHTTVFLEGTVGNCGIDLSWNRYQNWTGGILNQEIWIAENGGSPILVETLDNSTASYSFTDVNDGSNYCIFIQTYEAGSPATSISNEICLSGMFSQSVNDLYITNIDVQPDNTIVLDWSMNDNVLPLSLNIRRSNSMGTLDIIDTDMPTTPYPTNNQYSDLSADASSQPLSYDLQFEDICGNTLSAVAATSIHLTGNATGLNSNQLNWTPLVIDNLTVFEYRILRSTNGTTSVAGTVNTINLSFDDVLDPSFSSSGTICYIIEAEGEVRRPDGTFINIVSHSNEFCIDQDLRIFVPNALAPGGLNQEFKPVILSGNIASYEMQIYDRYGSLVFTAKNPDDSWKGKKDGRKLPQGVYVYRIYLVLENGQESEKRGNVLLLR